VPDESLDKWHHESRDRARTGTESGDASTRPAHPLAAYARPPYRLPLSLSPLLYWPLTAGLLALGGLRLYRRSGLVQGLKKVGFVEGPSARTARVQRQLCKVGG
jgi:hypothetical protein